MPLFTDQTHRTIDLPEVPSRIISLVPSLTMLLADLGHDYRIVGITKFCIYPDEWFRTKTRIGGTKQVKMDTIHELKPDLIIANKEENVKEQVEELARHYPVYISDVNNLSDALQAIRDIGQMTGAINAANDIIQTIERDFNLMDYSQLPIKVCYLIWNDPFMTVGRDTFIHSMMKEAGFVNVFAHYTRYPEVSLEEIKDSGCEAVFLSSEPYPFTSKHQDNLKELLPGVKVILVNGEMFSWYGSRLRESTTHFYKIRYFYLPYA